MAESARPRILLTLSHYLPGYKSGGPLRSVLNLIEALHDEFSFLVLTCDRDLGDSSPYSGVEVGTWVNVGHAKVRYLAPPEWSVSALRSILNGIEYDLLYLNSFFARHATIVPLLIRRLDSSHCRPVLLAPRGEFSRGAISSKPLKKRLYMAVARSTGLLDNLCWQASSVLEAADIQREIGASVQRIHIASDLPDPSSTILPKGQRDHDPRFHVLFLSRISPMKNLDYALEIMAQVRETLVFNIYGPLEDATYWDICRKKLSELPGNITAHYYGSAIPTEVKRLMRENDLLFLPTRGENYGHVIAEALSVGTRILVSDQTPWRELALKKWGYDIPLGEPRAFVERIEAMARENAKDRMIKRRVVYESFKAISSQSQDIQDNRDMFRSALSQNWMKMKGN